MKDNHQHEPHPLDDLIPHAERRLRELGTHALDQADANTLLLLNIAAWLDRRAEERHRQRNGNGNGKKNGAHKAGDLVIRITGPAAGIGAIAWLVVEKLIIGD